MNDSPRRRRLRYHPLRTGARWALCLGSVVALTSAAAALDDVIDSPMYKAPELPTPTIIEVFPEEAKALWLKALERPEADVKCRAAEAIALAHRRRVKGLDTTIAPLVAALDRVDQSSSVRVAVAHALVALGAPEAAPNLWRHAENGNTDLRELIEPALARWDYRPVRAAWLERLRKPGTPQRSLVLAIQGLAAVGEEQAADRLRELALDERRAGAIRLEAARAVGRLRPRGLEKDAERLAADSSPRGLVARLAAAALLRHHEGDAAVRLLQRFALDPEPAVAAPGITRLLEIDAQLLDLSVERLRQNSDPHVRLLAVEALFRRPTETHLGLLRERLADDHPDVRVKARRSLYELAAKNAFRKQVLAHANRTLQTEEWRGLEQAAILLTQLDHKPAAARFVELLRFDRPEVFVTAAWGLRRLAVPETLPRVVEYVKEEFDRLKNGAALPNRKTVSQAFIDHQLSQLNQFVGQQQYGPAETALRGFVPRFVGPWESRAAAVWALGNLLEGKMDPHLASALEGRLNDTNSMPPEDDRVRLMCAVTIGRLKAKEVLPSLRQHFRDREPSFDRVNNACGWAIQHITGEMMPPPRTIRETQRDWFLGPDS